ncbi:MAG: GGDEF domain-containing protein [Alphaproteobacteria bacterium]|nr:GGDEF domain-containing protein [Alphaproteobacteria bacterium]MDE2043215.1 GGDEF domain-containing protein [Alphaproteobacteria bacterium]MDE2341415.1 GGDEF domain-containing protein [Alphaproteobacteria bacterium]
MSLNRTDNHSADINREEVERLRDENHSLRQSVRDLEERLATVAQLADTDTLTPLPNRRRFEREVDMVVRRVARYRTGAALLFVDVDGLKSINDAHGHGAGDIVLIHVGDVLRSQLRSTDLVARLGGDEFGILIEPILEHEVIRKIGTLTREISQNHAIIERELVPVSISIGYTMIEANDSVDTALHRADIAMYGEKRAHRAER